MRKRSLIALLGACLLVLAACGTTSSTTGGGGESGGDEKVDRLNVIVPAEPGGGWDQTGRAMQQVLQDEELVGSAQVQNIGGAGGTVGLAKVANEKDPNTLLVTGYVMVGAIETNESEATLEDTTPIAKLTEEQLVIVAPKDSPYETVDDLVADIKKKGKGVSITGGSAGGADHILAGLIFKDQGVDVKDLNYIPYSGGGESLAALLGGKVSAGISGVAEYEEQIKSGELKALAVSGEEASPALPDVQPLTEQDIDVVVNNWRGVVAPGSLSEEETGRLVKLMEDMHGTDAWKATLKENNWDDAALYGEEYGTFLDEDIKTVQGTLRDIGLTE